MKKKIMYLVAVALVLTACSSEEPITPQNQVNDAMGANPYRVSLTDALKNADALLGELSEGEVTRSVERKVESVEYYSRPGTRSLGGDTLLYLVNYADDAGFALLSADSRLRPIYAISDEGSMSFSDTTYNKGLALFARGVEAEITSLPNLPYIPVDSLILKPGFPVNPKVDSIRSVKDRVRPMLSMYQRNWDQDAPFNKYCFTDENLPAKVGCAAIAVAQIMAYHKCPEQYGEYTFDWDEINAGNIDMLAMFLQILGNDSNLKMSYGEAGTTQGSFASITRIVPTFENMGYSCLYDYLNFSEATACAMLKGTYDSQCVASPLLVTGSHPQGGHAWVIDGFIQYQYTKVVVPPITTFDDILYHCVWGWGGSSNGYYYWAKNQYFDNDLIEKDRYDSQETDWDFGSYTNNKIFGGFIVN